MRFRGQFLATVSALAISAGSTVTTAVAADLPARMPVKAPAVVEAAFDWTGFYIGAHGGGAWLDHKQHTVQPGSPTANNGACNPPINATSTDCTIKVSGALAGLHAGYNWQSGRFVYGIEVDGTWTDLDRTRRYGPSAIAGQFTDLTAKVEWLASARARLGMAINQTLVYATGGVAFGGVNSSWSAPLSSSSPNSLKADDTRVGWVAGGGIEYAFNRNWSLRAEGLYYDLGKETASVTMFNPGGVTYTTSFRHRIAVARAGLQFRW